MIGTCTPRRWTRRTISGTAAAAASVLTVIRTSSDPACASWATWSAVASGSAVSVFVIDWTTIGCVLPTGTPPTWTVTVGRRRGRRPSPSTSTPASTVASRPPSRFTRSGSLHCAADSGDVEIRDPDQEGEQEPEADEVRQPLGLDADPRPGDLLDHEHEHAPAVEWRERQDVHERKVGREDA